MKRMKLGTNIPAGQSFPVLLRRFFRWLATPHVFLAILMLILMVYLIVIPLGRMVETTLTVEKKDLMTLEGVEQGDFTLYHWTRMLFSKISKIILYTPLRNSLVVSAGATLFAFFLESVFLGVLLFGQYGTFRRHRRIDNWSHMTHKILL